MVYDVHGTQWAEKTDSSYFYFIHWNLFIFYFKNSTCVTFARFTVLFGEIGQIDGLTDWRIGELINLKIDELTVWRIDRLRNWRIDRLIDLKIDGLMDWRIDWLKIDGLTDWGIDWLKDW